MEFSPVNRTDARCFAATARCWVLFQPVCECRYIWWGVASTDKARTSRMCGRIESRSVNNCVSENLNREVSANWSEFQKKKKLVKISLNASFFFFRFRKRKVYVWIMEKFRRYSGRTCGIEKLEILIFFMKIENVKYKILQSFKNI